LAVTDGAVTDGAVTDGAVTDGAVTDGAVTDGAVTAGAVTDGTGAGSFPAARSEPRCAMVSLSILLYRLPPDAKGKHVAAACNQNVVARAPFLESRPIPAIFTWVCDQMPSQRD
jgi:hypothetical protein